jgi:predicted dehydrogenase
MSIKVAIAGLRHGHIFALHSHASKHPESEVVAVCEEDATTRDEVNKAGNIKVTHDNFEKMLSEVECDVVAIGDYYAKRGSLAIAALKAGKHIVADKPICTSLTELEQIISLSQKNNQTVGCMLDMRDNANVLTAKKVIDDGEIGEIQAIFFGGQHPLMYGTRAGWYFEEGKQGGTINDIAIHALDFLPWVTGLKFKEVTAARSWNTLKEVPFFEDSSQMMLVMENGGGVIGDVSYLAPDSHSYSIEHYWRTTFWGKDGVIETGVNYNGVKMYKNGEKEMKEIAPSEGNPGGYFNSFVREIKGESTAEDLTTEQVLNSAKIGLLCQKASDKNETNVSLSF